MRAFCQSFLILMLLVSSVEGAIDRASAGHPHGQDPSHEISMSDAHEHSQANEGSEESTEAHCEHCCHGHSSSINASISAKSIDGPTCSASTGYDKRIVGLVIAPPTPPPNA